MYMLHSQKSIVSSLVQYETLVRKYFLIPYTGSTHTFMVVYFLYLLVGYNLLFH